MQMDLIGHFQASYTFCKYLITNIACSASSVSFDTATSSANLVSVATASGIILISVEYVGTYFKDAPN
jgi:hypothetical protein